MERTTSWGKPSFEVRCEAIPPGVPVWQLVLSAAGVAATTVGCVYVAGRIFRVGILLQGKGASLGQLAKWIFRG